MGRDGVAGVALLVVVVLVAAGPLTGVDVTSAETQLGEGDAAVGAVSVETAGLTVTPGRFGSEFSYLRVPAAVVTVNSVTDRPRLVYVVSVPALDVERVETAVVDAPGMYTLDPDDVALAPGTAAGTYDAAVTVRVQSFGTSRLVHRENATVEVPG